MSPGPRPASPPGARRKGKCCRSSGWCFRLWRPGPAYVPFLLKLTVLTVGAIPRTGSSRRPGRAARAPRQGHRGGGPRGTQLPAGLGEPSRSPLPPSLLLEGGARRQASTSQVIPLTRRTTLGETASLLQLSHKSLLLSQRIQIGAEVRLTMSPGVFTKGWSAAPSKIVSGACGKKQFIVSFS